MNKKVEHILRHHIKEWNLTPDGDRFQTHSSLLQPVLYEDLECMLKISLTPEEKRGGKLLEWWNGKGVANVLKSDEDAILMEKIVSDYSLKSMSLNGKDDCSTRIICKVANLLHSCNKKSLPELIPLNIWFKDLFLSADRYGSLFLKAGEIAASVLENQTDLTVLHGDLHHDNILFSSTKGWVAIDPKGLFGDKAFDYVNILCNPTKEIALSEGRLMKQIKIISQNSGVNINHILKWTIAWAALSAVWLLNDDIEASLPTGILEIAIAKYM